MTVARAHVTKPLPLARFSVPLAYLGVMLIAELFIALELFDAGLIVEVVLIVALVAHGSHFLTRDPTLGALLVAMTLAPLDRLLSLAVPRFGLPTLAWLGLVSIPLLVAVASIARVQRIGFRDLGLDLPPWRALHLQLAIGATGIPLGFLEYLILRPESWLPGGALLPAFLGAVVVLLFATGISEEAVFRGILLRRATSQMGTLAGLLFVTVAFTTMHLFYDSPLDIVFVFGVGLLYGVVVLRTKSLWGVILSHTFDNVILYLVAPVLLLSV